MIDINDSFDLHLNSNSIGNIVNVSEYLSKIFTILCLFFLSFIIQFSSTDTTTSNQSASRHSFSRV